MNFPISNLYICSMFSKYICSSRRNSKIPLCFSRILFDISQLVSSFALLSVALMCRFKAKSVEIKHIKPAKEIGGFFICKISKLSLKKSL